MRSAAPSSTTAAAQLSEPTDSVTLMDHDNYVVAAFTFGSFREYVTDIVSLDEAQKFVTDPPDWYGPLRAQDSLRIYELIEVDR